MRTPGLSAAGLAVTTVVLGAILLLVAGQQAAAAVVALVAAGCWIVARRRPHSSLVRAQPLAAALGAIVGGVLALLWQPAPDLVAAITVTATGEKNVASKSTEVWLVGVGSPASGFSSAGFAGTGWERREGVMVSYRQQPNEAQWTQRWAAGAVLRLSKHPYSGIASVRIGGQERRLDLYADTAAYIDLPLPAPQVSWPKRVLQVLMIVAAGWAGALLAASSVPAAGWFVVGVATSAVMAGAATYTIVRDYRVSGDLELVVLHAESDSAKAAIRLDAGQGFVPELRLPLKNLTPSTWAHAATPVTEASVQTTEPAARLYQLDRARVPAAAPFTLSEHTPAVLAEFAAASRPTARVTVAGQTVSVEAPPRAAATAESDRLFLAAFRDAAGIRVGWSRTRILLPAWEMPTYAIRRISFDGFADNPPAMVFRIGSASGTFVPLHRSAEPTALVVAGLDTADSGPAKARKRFAAFLATASVLLLLPIRAIGSSMWALWSGPKCIPMLVCVAAALFWMGAALVIGWPGVMGWDGFSPYIQHGTGSITLWYGIGYPLVVSGLLYLGGPEAVTLLQVAICTLLICWAATYALRQGVPGLAPVLIVVVGIPATTIPIIALTHLRDALNGVLLSACALLFFAAFKPRLFQCQTAQLALCALIGALGAALVLLRTDNLAFLAVLLIAGVVLSDAPLPGRIGVAAVLAGIWLAANPWLERAVIANKGAVSAEKRLYQVTGVVNPVVGQVVAAKLSPETNERSRRLLGELVDVDHAVKAWTPFDIIYWHETSKGAPARHVGRDLWRLYLQLALEDPMTFLRARTSTFLYTLGHPVAAKALMSDVMAGRSYFSFGFHDHLLSDAPSSRRLSALVGFDGLRHLHPAATQTLLSYQARVASHVVPLIVLFGCMALVRRVPVSAAIAAAELARVGVFWAFEPASVYLYLSELQLLGVLLPMLAWGEGRARRPDMPRNRLDSVPTSVARSGHVDTGVPVR